MTWSRHIRILLTYLICILIAGLCAWVFGSALETAYPEGILVFPPESRGTPPPVSDSFRIGMAMGWFFCCLVYALVSTSCYLFSKFGKKTLDLLIKPMLLASITSGLLVVVSIWLAN